MNLITHLEGLGCLEELDGGLRQFQGGLSEYIQSTYPFEKERDPAEPGGGVWAQCRSQRILSAMRRRHIHTLLDAGAGDGDDLTIGLSRNGIDVVGLEPSHFRAQKLSLAGVPTIRGSVQDFLAFGENVVPNVGMFDSLQYVPAEDNVLQTVFRALQPGGYLFLTVPGIKWLFSSYDQAVGNLRRFSRRGLESELDAAGFTQIKIEGLFAFLIPLAVSRKLLPRNPLELSDRGSRNLNRVAPLFNLLSRIEELAPPAHGLSLLVAARKPLRLK
jgi:SAM-dependent methyltransferase